MALSNLYCGKMVQDTYCVCRLCLTQCEEDFENIDESHQEIFNALNLNPDLAISHEPVMCKPCVENLHNCLTYKTVSLHMNKDTKDDNKCMFCSKSKVADKLILLNSDELDGRLLKANMKQFFPELDLDSLNPKLCIPCSESVQDNFDFLVECRKTERRIRKYCLSVGANSTGQIDLVHVIDIMGEPDIKIEDSSYIDRIEICDDPNVQYFPIKNESDGNGEEPDVKCEYDESHLKALSEEIKIEDVTESGEEVDTIYNTIEAVVKKYSCDEETIPKTDKNNTPKKKDCNRRMQYCDLCSYTTNRRHDLDKHKLVHKSADEVQMYQCRHCVYRTRHKHVLTKHERKHATLTKMYKCSKCSFETKHLQCMPRHLRTHESESKPKTYKCDKCSFESLYKTSIKNHTVLHMNKDRIAMSKCQLCPFQTKSSEYLRKHMVIHKTEEELTMYKCEVCDFESKHQRCLHVHMIRVHKKAKEVGLLTCHLCGFQAKIKYDLIRHIYTHRKDRPVTMHKCGMCNFQTKRKSYLRTHAEKTHKKTK